MQRRQRRRSVFLPIRCVMPKLVHLRVSKSWECRLYFAQGGHLNFALTVISRIKRHYRWFSELMGEAGCTQEYAGGLKQGLDNEAEPVIAQREASVLQDPGIAALDRPAVLSQS